MNDSALLNQSIDFSVEIVKFYKWLSDNQKEYVMSKQLLRSATSIGANIHEAQFASSRADFVVKMQIALKEASETEYWLTILKRTNYLSRDFEYLCGNCLSIKRMLISTIKTSKNNI